MSLAFIKQNQGRIIEKIPELTTLLPLSPFSAGFFFHIATKPHPVVAFDLRDAKPLTINGIISIFHLCSVDTEIMYVYFIQPN